MSQGGRPGFAWALPRALSPDADMMGPVLAMYLSLEKVSGKKVTFVVPDITATAMTSVDNNTSFLPCPMDYKRWLALIRQFATDLQLPADLAAELWSTYSFRRLLPTISDILGMHEGHRQQLG